MMLSGSCFFLSVDAQRRPGFGMMVAADPRTLFLSLKPPVRRQMHTGTIACATQAQSPPRLLITGYWILRCAASPLLPAPHPGPPFPFFLATPSSFP